VITTSCPWCGEGNGPSLCVACRAKALSIPSLSRSALENLPYGVIKLDAAGIVLSLNRAEEKLSQIERQRTVGRNFFTEIAPCANVQDFQGRFKNFLNSTEPLEEFGFTYPFASGAVRVHLLFVRVNNERALLLVSKRILTS
jgi:photoactive yellow protein